MTLDTRFKRCREVVEREDEETLLFHRKTSEIKVINHTGKFVWDRLDGKTPFSAIAAAMVKEYRIEPAAAEKDAGKFLQELIGMKFITPL